MSRTCLTCLVWLSLTVPAAAHSLTMSVLSIEQQTQSEFITSWSHLEGVQDSAAAYLLLRPLFPEHCHFTPPRLHCASPGLQGRLGFAGLGAISASATIQIRWLTEPSESYTFSAVQPQLVSRRAQGPRSLAQLAYSFILVGVEHIWLGWDHLLFVLGLLWLVRTGRALLGTISAFTLAHSLTLSAATLGLTTLPVPPVEAVIALSIACLAVELVKRRRDGVEGLTARAPWLVAFAFGLLHGLGFASALAELSLARAELPLALLFFNVGVELGQLLFVALVWSLRPLFARLGDRFRQRAEPLAQYALGSLAMYWFIERLLTFSDGG